MFNDVNKAVMSRPDEPLTQMAYFLYNNGVNNLIGLPETGHNIIDELKKLSIISGNVVIMSTRMVNIIL